MKKLDKIQTNNFSIKPAARHILTIGRDLIKDNNTALLELIKNSYDADAKHVEVEFSELKKKSGNEILITVKDDGHGMDYKTVTTVWMVPSTFHKQNKLVSESKKRLLQGRKGIGRYAASILGNELQLETTRNKETTTLILDWSEFEKKEYLHEIQIPISHEKTGKPSGTIIRMIGGSAKLREWDEAQIEDLIRELRRLISPIHEKDKKSDFQIKLLFNDFSVEGYQSKDIIIEPFPILDVFDYRISGTVSETGEANLVFENGLAKTLPDKIRIRIPLPDNRAKYCGKLKVDFKVYDRDTESINNLIDRISKKPGSKEAEKLSKADARILLTQISGVAVYRSGFRIRPHGDPGYDWLTLDRRRVQNPGVRFGSDRVSGFVEIEPEEKSHLEEKANREGLKENRYYDGLVKIALTILAEAEVRRYDFKLKTGKEKSQKNLNNKLDNLFDFSDVTKTIDKKLAEQDVPEPQRKEIAELIGAKVEESNKVIEDVKKIIAIYQGQATLGKIVRVVLHEGRNPISYFQNQIPVMEKWIKELNTKFTKKLLSQFSDRLENLKRQATSLVGIFNRISPLATQRRSNPTVLDLKKILGQSIDIFSHELKTKKIKITLICPENTKITAWPEDINHCIVNLLDNSLYWLSSNKKSKEIRIEVKDEENNIKIIYKDNGPGIEEKFISDELIFEPGFSTKPDGTGLGLAIAGESIERSGGKLSAIYSNSGALFEIVFPVLTKE